jgi:hypothetical protein
VRGWTHLQLVPWQRLADASLSVRPFDLALAMSAALGCQSSGNLAPRSEFRFAADGGPSRSEGESSARALRQIAVNAVWQLFRDAPQSV